MYKQFLTTLLALSVAIACGKSDLAPVSPTASGDPSLTQSLANGAGGNRLPTCSGASDCAAGPAVCTGEDGTAFVGPTLMTDYSSGVSSDGRGSYIQGTDGVRYSVVLTSAFLTLDPKNGVKNPRRYTVNLGSPVPGGGGVPLGIVTAGNDVIIETQWHTVNNARQNLNGIAIGATVTAEQIDVTFHINGRFHILQMGPQAYGHCHAAPTLVTGAGTSSGTIYRASATKWVIDLPAGSVGRLFDLYNTTQYAVDKGLYYTRLHYEIGN